MTKNKTNTRKNAAIKAAQTRLIRRTFEKMYPTTARIARDLITSVSDVTIRKSYKISKGTLAAVKANLCRNNLFGNMAYSCNF